jgi:hypothetical protein
MKSKDNTLAILFITVLTIGAWIWAAGKSEHSSPVLVTLYLSPPEGSASTISPDYTSITIEFTGTRSAVDAAKSACENGLHLTLSESDEVSKRIAILDLIKDTGANINAVKSSFFPLAIHTVEWVEAAVEVTLQNVVVSGDVTVEPATIQLNIPKELRKSLPEALTVQAVISENTLRQLQPGIVHAIDGVIKLSEELESAGVTATPSRVTVTFKIQSSTKTKELAQVRVLIAGPAEDYASYTVDLPRKTIPNVTIEAEAGIIEGIETGNVKVFAILRLASSDMEQQIATKRVTVFMAIMENGTGHELIATVEDLSLLEIELVIKPLEQPATQ